MISIIITGAEIIKIYYTERVKIIGSYMHIIYKITIITTLIIASIGTNLNAQDLSEIKNLLLNEQGDTVTVGSLIKDNQPLLIQFTNSYLERTKNILKVVPAFKKEYGLQDIIICGNFYGIETEFHQAVLSKANKYFQKPVYYDLTGKIEYTYDVSSRRVTVLFDKNGKLVSNYYPYSFQDIYNTLTTYLGVVFSDDFDKDGVLDMNDDCPEIAGKKDFSGCPQKKIR